MAVQCLTKQEKNYIEYFYSNKKATQKELAIQFEISERTINRVLNELGLATAVPRLKGEAYQVMQLLKKYGYTPASLKTLLESMNAKQAT